jgi:SAM-dependent methyltransferase
MFAERAIRGQHEFIMNTVLTPYLTGKHSAIDLGAGSGALALRLQKVGLDVIAVDSDLDEPKADIPFIVLDLNYSDFASAFKKHSFDIVISVEVIEHLENPIGFLRSVNQLLKPSGIAIITTPNVNNLLARIKFFLTGKIRTMDEHSIYHISPIFLDLFQRQMLPRCGLRLVDYFVYPLNGYALSRSLYRWVFSGVTPFLNKKELKGDSQIFVLASDS